MEIKEKKPIIYTAFSKHYFYARMLISAYVLGKDCIPLNPFTNWEYFMNDMVHRDFVARGNYNLILLAEEIWVFGSIADGVYEEIKMAHAMGKPVRYYSLGKRLEDIDDAEIKETEFEKELFEKYTKEEIEKEIWA